MPIQSVLRNPPAAFDPFWPPAMSMQERERRLAVRPMEGDAPFESCTSPRMPVRRANADIADEDWDILFDAVRDRLTSVVSASGLDPFASSATQIRDRVLECVEALGLLQNALADQRLRRQGLESAVFEAQTSLAQVRAALIGTQQGERRARHDASHDCLTGLPNRALLVERIAQHATGDAPGKHMFAVMFLDLNKFKQVNDMHGHAAGDALLRIVAARMQRAVRARDVVSRMGGDEFACMIGGVNDRAQLAQLADKMMDAISAPCQVGDLQLAVQASIGIATFPADGRSADALLKGADLAMYAAKRQRVRYAFAGRDDAAASAVRPGAKAPSPQPPRA